MWNSIKYGIKVFYLAASRLNEDDYSNYASALAYVTLLSLVPIISFLWHMVTYLPLYSNFIRLSQEYIYANFIPASSDTIAHYINQFTEQSLRLPIFSILFFIITGIMTINTISTTLNSVFCVSKRHRHFGIELLSWFILLLLPLLIGFSMFLSEYFSLMLLDELQYWVISLLHLLTNAVIFATLFIVVPNKHITWQEAFFGGMIAAILFETAKKVFVLYMLHFASYQLIYGALATIPIFLIWLYISWTIVLFSAMLIQINRELSLEETE